MNETGKDIDFGPQSFPILFSESDENNEHQIGWYKLSNGKRKPVYERTRYVNKYTNHSRVSHGFANIDVLIHAELMGISINNNTDWRGDLVPIPWNYSTDDTSYYYMGGFRANSTTIWIQLGSSLYSAISKFIVTLQYTKTTDEPID